MDLYATGTTVVFVVYLFALARVASNRNRPVIFVFGLLLVAIAFLLDGTGFPDRKTSLAIDAWCVWFGVGALVLGAFQYLPEGIRHQIVGLAKLSLRPRAFRYQMTRLQQAIVVGLPTFIISYLTMFPILVAYDFNAMPEPGTTLLLMRLLPVFALVVAAIMTPVAIYLFGRRR